MAAWRRGKPRPKTKQPGPHPDLRDEPSERVEPVGSIVRRLLSGSQMRRGLAVGRLVRGWEGVVGARLAAETDPLGIEGGALIVAASSGAWASQVSFLAAEIARNANVQLGFTEVQKVRVIVRPEAHKSLRHNRF